jgi:hypothetical protein
MMKMTQGLDNTGRIKGGVVILQARFSFPRLVFDNIEQFTSLDQRQNQVKIGAILKG